MKRKPPTVLEIFCNKGMFKCYLGCMICFSVFSMIVLSILQVPFDAKDEVGLNFMNHYPQGITQEYFDLPFEDLIERDNEWRDVLLYNEIIVCFLKNGFSFYL